MPNLARNSAKTVRERMQARLSWERHFVPAYVTRYAILLAVCAEFGIDLIDVKGVRRTNEIVDARTTVALLLRNRSKATYPLIGLTLGGRDHTTAINLVERGEALLKTNPVFAAKIAAVEAMLWPPGAIKAPKMEGA